ncbi:MAG: hypothetical protein R3B57_09645 [Phycisphaerales bacterium]
MLTNQFGRFIDGGRAYEITDSATPTPWTNVISNGRYGLVVSQNGGGFSWLDHCQLNAITRWNMDLVRDDSGRFLYIADLDASSDDEGSIWSLTPQPCRRGYDSYRCVHRPGMTSFETQRRGIRAVWELCVAPEDQAEVWRVRLTNVSHQPRRLRLGAYLEWCCGTSPDVKREFHKLFFTTRHDEPRRAVVATKNMWEAPFGTADDHWNRPWPHAAALAIAGEVGEVWATSDKADFLGRYADPATPRAMRDGVEGLFGRFVDAIAGLGTDLSLEPGREVVLHFVLGVADDQAALGTLLDRYQTPASVNNAFEGAGRQWDDLLAPTQARSGAPDFDLLTSTWLPYQAISARMWGRTGYYQQSGAYGYRDQLQDSQLWLALDPSRCREQILLHAAHQFTDGGVYHWWNPITETGLRTGCSDDYLWLPFIAASYVRETGDLSILDAEAPYVDDANGASLVEHATRSIERAFSRMSERGLPLIGENDWNDGLSHVGDETRGESVWLAMFLAETLREFGRALRAYGEVATADDYERRREALRDAVEAHGWDGAWYRRATDREGRWLGSGECLEGQIFLNPQSWAILTGIGDEERATQAWASVKAKLLTDYGPLLLAPAYTVPDAKIGYLSRYAPGARENGGVYMHAATWALAAACRRRDSETVARIWTSISPPLRCADAAAYAAEPYVTPGNVDGPLSATPGRAGWTWYTGSAAWLHRVSLEWVLGVRPTWEGLRIDPCPFPALGEVDVTRTWRGRRIRVRFDTAAFDASMAPVVTLDGSVAPGGVITEAMIPEGGEGEVRVSWAPRAEASPRVRMHSTERSKT